MATNFVFRVNAATEYNSKSVATAATTAASLGGATRIWIKCTEDARVRFGGSSVACTAGVIPLTADQDYVIDIAPDVTHYSAMRVSTSGTLYWVKVA